MAIPDPMAALVTLLLESGGPVVAQVGTRVFGGELPDNENQHMPRKCVVLHFIPGGTRLADWTPRRGQGLETKCYGANYQEAMSVHLAVYETLQFLERRAISNMLLYSATLLSGPMHMIDPDTDWRYMLASYNVEVGEQALV